MRLSIIVVNWNSGELLRGCVESVREALVDFAGGWELIVADNASQDGSVFSAGLVPPAERLLQHAHNVGFGRACNLAVRAARGEYLLLLNPDCELGAGSVERALAELERSDLRVGICGIGLVDADGRVWRSCHRFPRFVTMMSQATGLKALKRPWSDTAMLEWDHAEDRTVDHVIGAFYALRRSLFDDLGGFDERFFLYLEDLDFSLRAHRAGWSTRFLAVPRSLHYGGGTSQQIKAGRLFYATRSRVTYGFKHLLRWQAWVHLSATLFVEPFARTLHCVLRGAWDEVAPTWHAFGLLCGDLPRMSRSGHLTEAVRP
jgi:GT2 family glycosyltransferase